MSIVDQLMDYKRQYDEMDPYRRNQLNLTVIGAIVLAIALYFIINSFETVRHFVGK